MPTPYLDRAKLNALIGEATVTRAEADNQLDINAVIESNCALADGFVAAQVALPPSLTAQAQVAPLVAELVYCALMMMSGSEKVIERRTAVMRQLRGISMKPPEMLLHVEAVADNPATPELDESGTGAACGSAPRLTGWSQLRGERDCW